MRTKTRIALAVAIVASTTFTAASAATKHRRVVHSSRPIYDVVPSGGVSLSTQCLPTDTPCRTQPDGW
jgi:hypothetical protein